jgi:hypothetical protein
MVSSSSSSSSLSLVVTVEELECQLANLIYHKYVKGYISHRPPVLVIAKTGAFPKVSEIMAAKGLR